MRVASARLLLCLIMFLTGLSALQAAEGRRIVAYFADWRTGYYGVPGYLASDIPWDKVTHINYAFAKVDDSSNQIALADRKAAIEFDFPGQSNQFPYKGHFNVLNTYKQQYPHVKTLIAVGGWTLSRSFYTMAETATGREAFADSCVAFIRQYGFDGVDIDYEYPTATAQAGNPKDSDVVEPRRGRLFGDYVALMKLLRERLDAAGQQDGKHYLLTVAAPASSWILGGMALGEYAQYCDFINMMTYDFHGAWNGFVGHNSALLPDDRDPETRPLGVPVLNVDWSRRYYRGVVPPSKINVGIPYYSRGWRNVQKGSLPGGLYGSAATSNGGAVGIDNIWHDSDDNGNEVPSGTNPLWHIMNLANNRENLSYADDWGFDPTMTGSYERFFDPVCKAPYLWNDDKRVFLSMEDEESMRHRVQYVIDEGIGGIMLWELAGDYDQQPNGEYNMGYTLTTLAHQMLQHAPPADERMHSLDMPAETMDFEVSFGGNYDHPNYTFTLTLTNRSDETIEPGWKLTFSLPKTTTLNSVWGASFAALGEHDGAFDRYEITGPGWQALEPGASITLQGMMKLTFSGGPRLFVLNGKSSSFELPPGNRAPVALAGPDQDREVPAVVTLDGSASSDPDGDPLAYSWTQVSGPAVSLSTPDSPQAGFEVTSVSAATTYEFELAVSDGELQAQDRVRVVVRPQQPNRAPEAAAGADLTVSRGAQVTLDGGESTDPNNDPLTFLWEVPTEIIVADTGLAQISFTAPDVMAATEYRFTLVVSDGALEDRDEVLVRVLPNGRPSAQAGIDRSADPGDLVSLDGSGSTDPENDPLTFLWEVPAGVMVNDPTQAVISFNAPEVTEVTSLTFTLTVSDGELADSDAVTVVVSPAGNCGGPDPADFPAWSASQTYNTGDRASFENKVWQARWWTQNQQPGTNEVWQNLNATEDWDPNRDYNGGEECNYEGRRYRAQWWTSGQNPASSDVWVDVGPATGC